jgi:hypothetical protein
MKNVVSDVKIAFIRNQRGSVSTGGGGTLAGGRWGNRLNTESGEPLIE